MKKETVENLIIILLALLAFTSVTVLALFAPSLKVFYDESIFHMKAEENTDQELVKSLANVCTLYNSTLSQMKCVQVIVSSSGLYNYTATEDFVMADEVRETGGDCKSWTILYMATYKLMNLSVKPIYLDNHVYLTVYKDEYYCNVDQRSIDCHKLTMPEDLDAVEGIGNNSLINESNVTNVSV